MKIEDDSECIQHTFGKIAEISEFQIWPKIILKLVFFQL